MLTGDILYILYACISVAVPSVMAYLFWKKRSTIGALPMSLLMLCEIEWSLFCFLSAISSNMELKLLLNSFSFIAAAIMPVTWFIFSIHYTRQEKTIKKIHYYLLSIIPLITIGIVLTDPIHRLFISNVMIKTLPNSSFLLVSYDFGPLFWLHAIYSYVLLAIGAIILIMRLIGSFKIYRKQALYMIGALLVSFSGEVVYQLGIGPFNNMLITPFTFSMGGILLFICMFRYKALDIVPIACEAVIEIMDDLVIVLDKQNRIIDANSAARRLLSKEHQNLVGQFITNILPDIPSLADKTMANAKSHSEIMLEIDHKKAYYNVKLSPLYDKGKTIIGSLMILMDITALHEAMAKLEKERHAAESANKAKSDFLATMSHEIRTPINGIIGMAELLETAKLSVQEKENLIALQYSADSLLNLITDILDFSKIEAGKMEIEHIPFNLRELLNNIAKTFEYKKKNLTLSFTMEIDDNLPVFLVGDYNKLKQILSNMLSNAFKFTETGEVRVRVTKLSSTLNKAIIGFCISDTGIGIPADKIESLFQSFHQLDSSTTRKYGGTGLGLSIVKNLLTLMGGTIQVESAEGKGSRFCIELPFHIAENMPWSDSYVEASAALEPRELRILVAEDSRVNQMLIGQLLQKKGWTADIVENGEEALQRFLSQSYDLILMDIQMPVMDGYEAVKQIRQREQITGSSTPIIALTANATPEDRTKCMECGMEDFLSKPIKSDKLYECILKHINH